MRKDSSADLLLRPYAESDWPRLCEIHDSARILELRAAGLEAAFLSLEQAAENEGLFDGTVVVADRAGQIEGFVAFSDDELTWLYVDPALHRRGTGRALVRYVLQASKNDLSAEVLLGNEIALSLYRSEGFTVLKRVDGRLTGNEAFAASGYLLKWCVTTT